MDIDTLAGGSSDLTAMQVVDRTVAHWPDIIDSLDARCINEIIELRHTTLFVTIGNSHRHDGHIRLDDDGRAVIDLTGWGVITGTRAVRGVVDDGIRCRTVKTDLRTFIDQNTRGDAGRRGGCSLEKLFLDIDDGARHEV